MPLLPGAGQEQAAGIAERIRAAVEQRALSAGSAKARATVSVGYATTSSRRLATEMDLVALADEALYRAKAEGRNRVVEARAAA